MGSTTPYKKVKGPITVWLLALFVANLLPRHDAGYFGFALFDDFTIVSEDHTLPLFFRKGGAQLVFLLFSQVGSDEFEVIPLELFQYLVLYSIASHQEQR